MPVETGAQFISQLNASWPLGTDTKAEGDDHLRLVKAVLQNQFPNLGENQVTATAAELNGSGWVPVGGIIMWSGTWASIPSNWQVCDGTNSTPDLRDRFIVGSSAEGSGSHPHATTGGTAVGTQVESTNNGAHDHGNTGSTALTAAQMPSHSHGQNYGNSGAGGGLSAMHVNPSAGGSGGITNSNFVTGGGARLSTDPAGSGQAHNHSTNSAGGHTHTTPSVEPQWYALAYIMRMS